MARWGFFGAFVVALQPDGYTRTGNVISVYLGDAIILILSFFSQSDETSVDGKYQHVGKQVKTKRFSNVSERTKKYI